MYASTGASLVAQQQRTHLPMQKTRIRPLGQEDPLEEEMAPHSSFLPGESPWMEEPGRLQSFGSQRVRHDWSNSAQMHYCSPPGKGVHQGCILSPCLFNLYTEYIMQNPGLDEAQAGIKIAGRNINNLRYTDDTTLMVENEEELKSLLTIVKEESKKKNGLKFNI